MGYSPVKKPVLLFLFAFFMLAIIPGNPFALAGEAGGSPLPPGRIVCLSPYAAEILCDLGEANKIVAISKLYKNDPYYELLKDKPLMGGAYSGNINLEMVLGVNPDLVFCTEGNKDIFTSRGLKVYVTGTYDIDGIMGFISDIGKIAGQEEKADAIVNDMKTRIKYVEDKLKTVKKMPLVYFEQSDVGKTRAKGSLTHDLITRAGGINIAGDEPVPFPILSQEFILEKNPDIIIVEEWGTKPSTVKARDGWKNLKAVKSGMILVSKNYYTGYTRRCLDGLEAYARFFHPGLFDK